MSNILHDRQTSPPITCQPWCESGDGHPHEVVTDQCCNGIEHRVPLHLTEMRDVAVIGAEPDWQHDYLTVYPQKWFAREPVVFLGQGETTGVMMTPDEARQLAAELLDAVAQISGQS
jgi:hypothetical protein